MAIDKIVVSGDNTALYQNPVLDDLQNTVFIKKGDGPLFINANLTTRVELPDPQTFPVIFLSAEFLVLTTAMASINEVTVNLPFDIIVTSASITSINITSISPVAIYIKLSSPESITLDAATSGPTGNLDPYTTLRYIP